MSKEIERKFLIDTLPDFLREGARKVTIEQGYIALEQQGHEVRLRKVISDQGGEYVYLLTVKSTGELERAEYEVKLEQAQFEVLWPATEGRRLEKDRYLTERGSVHYEVDVYHRPLRGLIVAEVEFETKDKARSFDKPEWLGQEVTELSFLKNRRLLQFESFEELKEQL